MPGWESLADRCRRARRASSLPGLILLVVLAALAAFAAYQLARRHMAGMVRHRRIPVAQPVSSRSACAGGAGAAARQPRSSAYGYGRSPGHADGCGRAGQRRSDQAARRRRCEAQRPIADEPPNRYLKENSELRQKLIDAENKLAALERVQTQKHLSDEQTALPDRGAAAVRRPEGFDRLDPRRRRRLEDRPGVRLGVRGRRLGSSRRGRRIRPRNGRATRSASRWC